MKWHDAFPDAPGGVSFPRVDGRDQPPAALWRTMPRNAPVRWPVGTARRVALWVGLVLAVGLLVGLGWFFLTARRSALDSPTVPITRPAP